MMVGCRAIVILILRNTIAEPGFTMCVHCIINSMYLDRRRIDTNTSESDLVLVDFAPLLFPRILCAEIPFWPIIPISCHRY